MIDEEQQRQELLTLSPNRSSFRMKRGIVHTRICKGLLLLLQDLGISLEL